MNGQLADTLQFDIGSDPAGVDAACPSTLAICRGLAAGRAARTGWLIGRDVRTSPVRLTQTSAWISQPNW